MIRDAFVFRSWILAAVIDATHRPRFDQLTDIAIALGVNQSTADTGP